MSATVAPEVRERAELPRWSLAVVSAVHAGVFGWAAAVLPWREWTLIAIICGALASLHLLTAALAVVRHSYLALVWRVQSMASMVLLAYIGWGMVSSALYLRWVYNNLGDGLAGAILAILGLVVLVTVPLASWGLSMTGGLRWRRPSSVGTLLLVVGLVGFELFGLHSRASGEVVLDEGGVDAARSSVQGALEPIARQHLKRRPQSLIHRQPAACAEPPGAGNVTYFVTFFSSSEGARGATTRCLQAPTLEQARASLDRLIEEEVTPGYVQVELVVRTFPLASRDDFVTSLSIRPGIDGVCDGARCLTRWQLVASRVFDSYTPVKSVPSARLGASLEKVRQLLGSGAAPSLSRVETRGWLLDRFGAFVESGRTEEVDFSPEAVRAAALLSQRYILWSQLDSGRFRYIVDPYKGRVTTEPFSIARQAGTTLALCEVGDRKPRVRKAIRASLDHLAGLEKRFESPEGDWGFLLRATDDPEASTSIGATTLSLAAFLRCRQRLGEGHDALIGRLARTVIAQQRPDGGFYHRIHGSTGAPDTDAANRLYIDGQAVLGLVLLEKVSAREGGLLPASGQVRAAVDRAMAFTAGPYWSHFAGQFFYVEENWHCLAAAAALDHHRDDAYERFCLDYLTFKKRFIHDERSGSSEDFAGGWGFGNLVPPHNTSTAGFGEAMAAAILVKKRRGMDTTQDEALMRGAMTFLMRVQWEAHNCFACSRRISPAGGFTEHMSSTDIRIDFVQHAWAALSHGSKALGFEWAKDFPHQAP